MATFHVYVEGADDPSPAGLKRVAQAVSQRFGLSSDQLVQRLTSGRFRVKANVDRVTAESFVRALAECGAKASIEAADGAAVAAVEQRKTSSGSMPPLNVARKASPSSPPPVQARPATSSLPPATQPPRPATSSLPPATQRSGSHSLPPATARTMSKNSMQSGLSAAFGNNRAQSESEFNALGSGGSLSLASLDGDDAGTNAGAADQFAPAVKYEEPPPSPKASGKSPAQAPVDLFRPPDAEEAEALVDLAEDEVAARAVKAERASKASLPPANVSAGSVPTTSARFGRVESVPATALNEKEPTPPGRFAAGVLLAIILGFLPAHLVASSRETSTFRQIDAEIERTQQSAVTDEDQYRALDGFRAGQLARKQAERKSIAMMAMAIWAVAGAAVAYGFFFRVPWDKLGTKPAT